MRDVESVSCDVVNNTVYIYDQNGNTVNVLSIPGLENAYSTGRCIIAETETMSYTYKVRRDGSLGLPGIRGRVRAGSLRMKRGRTTTTICKCESGMEGQKWQRAG